MSQLKRGFGPPKKACPSAVNRWFLTLLNAGGGIRTLEPLRDEVLSLTPLTRLGDPRVITAR